jgi:hypothetical protein
LLNLIILIFELIGIEDEQGDQASQDQETHPKCPRIYIFAAAIHGLKIASFYETQSPIRLLLSFR